MSFKKILEIAEKFEKKIIFAQLQPQTSQWDTSSLFFKKPGDDDRQAEANQRSFAAAAQKEDGPLAKFLMDYWQKNNTKVSFTVTINATPGKGATFDVIVSPGNLKSQVVSYLDQIYQSIMKQSIASRQMFADQKAKGESAGSGKLPLAELIIE